MKTRDYLRKHYWLDKSIQADMARLETYRRLAEGTHNRLTKEPGASTQGDRMGHFVAAAADLAVIIDRRVNKLLRLRADITRAIDTVDDPKLNELLKKRYIDFLPWSDIAEDMGYSVRRLHELHEVALRATKLPE